MSTMLLNRHWIVLVRYWPDFASDLIPLQFLLACKVELSANPEVGDRRPVFGTLIPTLMMGGVSGTVFQSIQFFLSKKLGRVRLQNQE